MQPSFALRLLCLSPLVALGAAPHAVLQPSSPRPLTNNSIASFGWYWAMEDGTANATAANERNCTAPAPCSWDHANVDFVQNSWKSPSRWSPNGAADWDVSDVPSPHHVYMRHLYVAFARGVCMY